MSRLAGVLVLEDGQHFWGQAYGQCGTSFGEVCFNTSLTGYQEILTDPSYRGQIVTMTCPQIGNYGVNEEDIESHQPHLAGFIVREPSRIASNFRASAGLEDYLSQHQIVGLSGIDTRALVRHIRSHGAMKGVVSSESQDIEELLHLVRRSPGLVGRDLVREVVPQGPREWSEKLSEWTGWNPKTWDRPIRIVALDYGMKWNIARHLRQLGGEVTILPGTATAAEILAREPQGVFLSNGPGDPEPLEYAIEAIRMLLGKVPLFGICLGHQLLALACGAKTFKLKFGHRGSNQPVMNCQTGLVEITSQNHGFAVEEASLPSDLEITHRNLNDGTIAGLRHLRFSAFGVQFHPEASAGPHDSHYLFTQFRELVSEVVAA